MHTTFYERPHREQIPSVSRELPLHLTSCGPDLHKTLGRKELHSLRTQRHYLILCQDLKRLFDVRVSCSSCCWPLTDSCFQTPLEVPFFKETVLLLSSCHRIPVSQTLGDQKPKNGTKGCRRFRPPSSRSWLLKVVVTKKQGEAEPWARPMPAWGPWTTEKRTKTVFLYSYIPIHCQAHCWLVPKGLQFLYEVSPIVQKEMSVRVYSENSG